MNLTNPKDVLENWETIEQDLRANNGKSHCLNVLLIQATYQRAQHAYRLQNKANRTAKEEQWLTNHDELEKRLEKLMRETDPVYNRQATEEEERGRSEPPAWIPNPNKPGTFIINHSKPPKKEIPR